MYKVGFLNHLKAIKAYLSRYNGHANVNVDTCVLDIRIGGYVKKFQPQFLFRLEDGRTAYSSQFALNAAALIGWLPYANKRWELAAEKLKFKEYLTQNGIPTPAYSADPAGEMNDVIIKKSRSSFGDGIKGPFKSSQECQIDAQAGEFYERFVMGKIAKIWYWNAMPVVMELIDMPRLTGNGVQTIRDIYATAIKARSPRCPDIEECVNILKFQGCTPETVLKENESVVLDFKYLSLLIRGMFDNRAIACDENHVLYPQLKAIGEVLWKGIPEMLRQNTAYSVDAILDENGVLSVLEMNSNPQLHPDIYATMLEGLFFNRPLIHQVNPPKQQ